jgi:predicted HTH transcriptional regulator
VSCPPILYEAERQKFTSLMEEARELAMVSLREEFAGIVSHLVERLAENGEDKPKILRNGMFEKFQEFLENFTARNIFQDNTLSDLVTQARQCLSGLDGQTVKTNGWLKNTLAEEMAKLKTQITSAIEEMPRRYIRYSDRSLPESPANAA